MTSHTPPLNLLLTTVVAYGGIPAMPGYLWKPPLYTVNPLLYSAVKQLLAYTCMYITNYY